MSDEQRKDEETEVEAHSPRHASPRHAANIEPPAEVDYENDVEAHVRRANVRMDSPRHI
jgi:hypothetical protein